MKTDNSKTVSVKPDNSRVVEVSLDPKCTGEANARLIAAAPELLEACLEMISARVAGGLYDQDLASVKMKAAVRKAKGI